ncbi:hypothetical protein ACQR1I_15935 [Bradyrhizobium sp. HKCCYLS2038]|uniref:hypothetical protein n=1 Tax=unclassified Bradyrhizobium TaxID=2631580 RepID=UPI003EBE0213
MASRTAGVAIAIAAGIAGLALIVMPRVVMAAEDCLTEPSGEKSDAQRWYYRFDRGTNRRCWYLKDANGNTRDIAAPPRTPQQPAPWDFGQPTPPKLTAKRGDGPATRTAADALAEAPAPRLRTDLAVRGTPKPQNVAITPTTLTASDASLPRSLDSSPWPSAAPQRVEPTTSDVSPAAMADEGNAEADANATPPADGSAMGPPKTTKPGAPIPILMLVVVGALAISGLLASALYRLSRVGRKRRRGTDWHATEKTRRSRAKPRGKVQATANNSGFGQFNARGASAGSAGFRTPEPASALDVASARLSASMPEQVPPRPTRATAPAAYQDAAYQDEAYQDRASAMAGRRERDEAAEVPRLQPAADAAVWQAADQLADQAAVRHAAMTAAAATAQGDPRSPVSQAAPGMQQAQLAAAQRAAAHAAAAKLAAAQAAAREQAVPQNAASPGAPAATWPAAQMPPVPAAATTAATQPAAPSQPAPADATAPVDVGEIVSALRRARSGAGATAGAAPMDAAKVIAALLVSRAAKRRDSQPTPGDQGAAPPAVPMAGAAATQAFTPQATQSPQQQPDRAYDGQAATQRAATMAPSAGSSAPPSNDPAAALIETLRAHAARQPTRQPDDEQAPLPAAAMESPSDDSDLDDPAAALINLLQSRFALPEDEMEAESPQDDDREAYEAEAFVAEAPRRNPPVQGDPAAQLMSLLESRSSLPPVPAAPERPRPQPQQQRPQPHQHQPHQHQPQQHQPQQHQTQQHQTQQQRALFVPPPYEDPATPPLDFIPRPQALRPRPRNIHQQDDELDGIQDILARLGRRA